MKTRFAVLAAFILLFSQTVFTQAQSGACNGSTTFIHDIQGSGANSPMTNQTVTIRGIVTGDFQQSTVQLRGFYMQEETADADANPATSEGIFVFDKSFGIDVNPGDMVQVSGKITEFASSGVNLTELSDVTAVTVCSSGNTVNPVAISLPINNVNDWERYEGMLVTFPDTLTVTENFSLGRYGLLTLSQGGRLFQTTNVAAPGAAANALADQYTKRTIMLDDGNLQQNRDPIVYPAPGLSATNTLRDGYTVSNLTGILDQRNGAYEVEPVGTINFAAANPRPTTPPTVGGTLKIASMNVLNYFNGDGAGGGFPTERGATTLEEFNRQRDKIINAIAAVNADILGLMEVENDTGPTSAIADIVNGVNAKVGANTYTFIDTGVLGTDAIHVAVMYKPSAVQVVNWATNNDPVFSRPPILATFKQVSNNEQFTLAVNHLKSKGSCPTSSSDPNNDQSDGQSCWNTQRVQQAKALTDWMATDPTHSGDPDFLIIGDLNAYAKEDPITAIKNVGFTDLIAQFVGDQAYSFMFMGQAGYLDHALASKSLVSQVTGAGEWHINADEPPVLDYNEEFKSPAQITGLYSSAPFRTSDHDPLIVGLNLSSQPEATDTPIAATSTTPMSSATSVPSSSTPASTNTAVASETAVASSTPASTNTVVASETAVVSSRTPPPTNTALASETPAETETSVASDTPAVSTSTPAETAPVVASDTPASSGTLVPSATPANGPSGGTTDNTGLIGLIVVIIVAILAFFGVNARRQR